MISKNLEVEMAKKNEHDFGGFFHSDGSFKKRALVAMGSGIALPFVAGAVTGLSGGDLGTAMAIGAGVGMVPPLLNSICTAAQNAVARKKGKIDLRGEKVKDDEAILHRLAPATFIITGAVSSGLAQTAAEVFMK